MELQWCSGEYIWWLLPLVQVVLLFWSPGYLRGDHDGDGDDDGDIDGGGGDDGDGYGDDDGHDNDDGGDDDKFFQFGDDCRPYWGGDFIVSTGFRTHVTHW